MGKVLRDWWDYVEDAVTKTDGRTAYHVLPIAITSQAEGAMRGDGWGTGQGKSTVAAQIAKKIWMDFYGYDEWTAEEMVKKFFLANWTHYREALEYGMKETRIPVVIADDFDEWAGKHVSHSKAIQWAARNFIKYRPYIGVFLATMSHTGALAASWREKWMFNMTCYTLGKTEIQYIKIKTNFGKPHEPYAIMDKNTIEPKLGEFKPMSKDFQKWYNPWRDHHTQNSFKEGWEKHFGPDDTPDMVPEAMTNQDKFTEYLREELGIKASNAKVRALYNDLVKPTVKIATA